MTALPATTLDGLERPAQHRRGLWGRRVFLTVLLAVVAAGAWGLLGVQTATTRVTNEGWTLELEHASVARAGLDVPFTVTVEHAGGFGEQVTLALTGTYLDLYETQGFNPEPDSTSRDGETLFLTFEAPPRGEVLVVTYDAYIQPTAPSGSVAELSVLDEGSPVVSLDFRTRIWP